MGLTSFDMCDIFIHIYLIHIYSRKDCHNLNNHLKSNEYQFKIGEVYLMKFDGTDSEQSGWRPGLIFQNNTGNCYSPNTIALPLTSSIKKLGQPTHVFIPGEQNGLYKDSIVLCENPQRISKNKIGAYITTLSDDIMGLVASASLLATSAIAYISIESLIAIRERAVELNSAA